MFRYFVPAFVGVVASTLYNIVDRIFIGRGVGAEALSGVSVVFPIMLIMMGFGMLIGIGAGVMVSINLGRKNKDRAEKILGTGFVMMLLVSAVLPVVGFILKKPLLRSFGATQETFRYANDYLNIILFGVVFQMVGFSLNNIIRAEGNARVAMYSMLLSAGINIVLNPVFIFILGWGVKGSALATVISMIILDIWVIAHFRSRRSVVKLRKEYIKADRVIFKDILAIGISPFAMQVAGSFVHGILNTKLIFYGSNLAVGAMGIINSVTSLVVMTIVAINMASQPIIGFNYGAKMFGRVREALKKALTAATFVALLSFVLIEIFAKDLVGMFNTSSPELIAIAVPGLRTFIMAMPVIGFQIVTGNYFQSVGKAKTAMLLTLLRQVLVLLPLLLILPSFLGIKGIWIASPVADVVSAIIVSFFLAREWKRLRLIG